MSTIQIADKPTLDTISTNVTTVKDAIQDSTYGLSAIKTAIGNIGGGALVPVVLARNTISGQYSMAYTPTSSQRSTYKYFTACIYNVGSNIFSKLFIDDENTSVLCSIASDSGESTFVFTTYIQVQAERTTQGSMIVYGWK